MNLFDTMAMKPVAGSKILSAPQKCVSYVSLSLFLSFSALNTSHSPRERDIICESFFLSVIFNFTGTSDGEEDF